jgi:hypothetical protein
LGEDPHSALELRFGDTTISASQLQSYLQVSPLVQFPENHDIVEQPTYQHIRVFDVTSPNANAEEDLIPTFVDSIRIISCLEVIVVDVVHTPTSKTCFVCPENGM